MTDAEAYDAIDSGWVCLCGAGFGSRAHYLRHRSVCGAVKGTLSASCHDCTKHLERLTQWARDTGFTTGHADSVEQLMEEVGEQVEALRAKYREPSVPVSALQPLCSRYIGDPRYGGASLFHDLQRLIIDAERGANDE